MRLPCLLKTSLRFRTVAACGLIGGLALLSGGCDVPHFVDPGETAGLRRVGNGEPLVVKILDDLDPVLEEGNRAFVSAQLPRPEDLVSEPSDYVVGANDLLTVTVSDLQGPGLDTIKQTRVSGTGNITLPYLPTTLRVEGLTEAEIQQSVKEAYRQGGLLDDAQVSVSVVEARGRAFSVMGAVARPALYQIVDEDFRLLDALTQAGDIQNPLIDELFIIRKSDQPRRRAAGMGAGGMGTTNPSTVPADGEGPADDDLAPQGNSGRLPARMSRAAYLQAEGEADPLDPDAPVADEAIAPEAPDADAPEAPDADVVMEDPAEPGVRAGRIDGQGIVVQPGDDATATEPGMSAGMAPPVRSTEGFEFNDPPAMDDVRVIRIPLARLMAGDLQYNVAIRPGDTIMVPPGIVGNYYMEGHVASPGAYTFQGQKVTLREAIWAARGLDGLAIPQRTDIVRKIGPNQKMHVRVDLARVFAGTAPDIYLKPGDEVSVGTNFVAPFLAAIRGGFRFTYGFGFLYDRNYGQQFNDNNR